MADATHVSELSAVKFENMQLKAEKLNRMQAELDDAFQKFAAGLDVEYGIDRNKDTINWATREITRAPREEEKKAE